MFSVNCRVSVPGGSSGGMGRSPGLTTTLRVTATRVRGGAPVPQLSVVRSFRRLLPLPCQPGGMQNANSLAVMVCHEDTSRRGTAAMHGSVAAGAACATCGALPGDPLELDRAVEEHAEPAAIARTGRVITRLGIFIGPGESQGDAMRISTRWTLVLTL